LFNITLGVENDKEQLEKAIWISQLKPVIDRLPNGPDTNIRERGVNLSGGERQRLALARGIYAAKDSSIILLDEPTSNIDLYHESRFYDELFAAFPNTCIVCAVHGLHLLPRFDRILTIERGTLATFESFDELVAKSDVYKRLLKNRTAEKDK